MKKDKLIIFDLDGTLYQFRGKSFRGSGLQKRVLENALKYIQSKLQKTLPEAQKILREIQQEYGEDISIALEEKYNCSRKEYFDNVWNIEAKGIIGEAGPVRKIIERLNKQYELLLMSDGAEVWIQNVLKELRIEEFFREKILSGDGKKRKSLFSRFDEISDLYNFSPGNIIVVGDQEKTDIIPAKKCGFKTIFINRQNSKYADVNIKKIQEAEWAIKTIFEQDAV